ncbi:MAG: hypothetical protein IPN71_16705 [Fibrobacteres bacterium]|nr:hypothetical protein [Fibrobacterota bacterium]
MEQRARADHHSTLVAGPTGSIAYKGGSGARRHAGIAPLAVDTKDDRNLSTDAVQQSSNGR